MVGKRSVGGEECGEGKIIKVEGDVPLLAVKCVSEAESERRGGREVSEEGREGSREEKVGLLRK